MQIDFRILVATAVLLIPTVLLVGLLPAIRLSAASVGTVLARGGRTTVSSPLSRRGSRVLIAAEVALAVILLAGAGLMIRTYMRLSAVDLGFQPEGLTTVEILPLSPDLESHQIYFIELLRQLQFTAGIDTVGGINNFPLGGGTAFTRVTVDGDSFGVNVFQMLPGYFETIRAPLEAGRLPTIQDYAAVLRGSVINRLAASSLFDGGPAVGRQFTLSIESEPWTVLGVVADIRHGGPLGAPTESQIYLPFEPREFDSIQAMTVVLRTERDALASDLRAVARSIGPPVLVERIRSANDWFGDRVLTPRRRTVLLSLLSGLGLLLALERSSRPHQGSRLR